MINPEIYYQYMIALHKVDIVRFRKYNSWHDKDPIKQIFNKTTFRSETSIY